MAAQYRDIDLLWRDYFSDPSQWRDYRKNKRDPKCPDFKHKRTKEPLWINGWNTPPWVKEELARQGLQLHHQWRPNLVSVITSNHNPNWEMSQDDIAALMASLKACANQKDLCRGSRLHYDISKSGLLASNVFVASSLVNMYAKCGALAKAREVFDGLQFQNVVLWNALIAGYTQQGHAYEALNCFEQMQQQDVSPDAVTFTCILKACGSVKAAEKGEEIHAEVVRQGLLDKDTILGTALVDMYAKCGALTKAQYVFDELPVQHVGSWNVLIAGYTQHGHGHEALNCFEQMKQQGVSPNAITFTCILSACGSVGAAEKGEEIQAEAVRQGLLEKNVILGTALVDMYAKCGALAKAQEVFDDLSAQDLVSWNALIAGYAQHGHCHKALNCLEQMQQRGLSPDASTFTCIFKACGSIGAVEKGEEIHAEVVRQGLLAKDAFLSTALVDMYVKCGALAKAQEVFDELPVRHVASWNALIAGYSHVRKVETVFHLFNRMITEGTEPDPVTFIVLLNACSHSGLIDQGQMYFVNMSMTYGILPTLDHYTCMVDLFARAGHLDEAICITEKMPPSESSCHVPLWFALLGACLKWGNVKHGNLAFEHVVQLDKRDAMPYVLMSNIHAASSMK